jgi:hypothetical protein
MTVEELSKEAINISDRSEKLFEYLWEGSKQLLDAGVPEDRVAATLEALYDTLGEHGRYDAQDDVVEVLNGLTGYCSPSARLRLTSFDEGNG